MGIGAGDWRHCPPGAPDASIAGAYNCAMSRRHQHEHDHGTIVETSRPEVAPPPLYSVLLLNDDYTPMDFVVEILTRFFALDIERATQVMLHVHTRGRGVCGVYSREVAESKVAQVNEYARLNLHPLLCTMEKA
jgi:ATP-dependent Clp protease adaptor protein ClpS